MKVTKRIKRALLRIGVVVVAVFTIIPFVWVISASLRTSNVITGGIVPNHPSLANYTYVLTNSSLPANFVNSLVACGFATLLNIPVATLAAFAFSRLHFLGKRHLYLSVLITQLLPGAAIVIPLYQLWATVGFFNSRFALGLAYAGITMAVGILLLRGFFDTIPRDLDEAAAIDGCNLLQTFYLILLPLAKPAIIATAIYTFLTTWQDFLFSSSLMNDPSQFTLTVGLYSFIGDYATNWGAIMAGAVITAAPIVIIFALLQKYFVQTVVGSVKG